MAHDGRHKSTTALRQTAVWLWLLCGSGDSLTADDVAADESRPSSTASTDGDTQSLPLSESEVEAWTAAGARLVSIPIRSVGPNVYFDSDAERIPGFRFSEWSGQNLAGLPVPDVPFGLNQMGTPVTDADLQGFVGLTSLEVLNLDHTQFTDLGTLQLMKLHSLRSLSLCNLMITDVGIDKLSALTQLRALGLASTRIRDRGLRALAGLTRLETLHLDRAEVTDRGLQELAGLPALSWLTLGDMPVTDAGLQQLASCSSLEFVLLRNTLVTEDGIQQLRNALPRTKVGYAR